MSKVEKLVDWSSMHVCCGAPRGVGACDLRNTRTAQTAFTPRLLDSRLHLKGIGQHLSHASTRKPAP